MHLRRCPPRFPPRAAAAAASVHRVAGLGPVVRSRHAGTLPRHLRPRRQRGLRRLDGIFKVACIIDLGLVWTNLHVFPAPRRHTRVGGAPFATPKVRRWLWVVAMGGCYGWLLWVVAMGGWRGTVRNASGPSLAIGLAIR